MTPRIEATTPLNEKVRVYYDRNTPIFVKIGRSSASANIHRAVWGKNVGDEIGAMTYVNRLIKEEMDKLPFQENQRVLDLGCGVGAPLFYLHENFTKKARYTGISISGVQIQMANKFLENSHPDFNGEFIKADFHDLPELPDHHIIYLVEAFIHSNDADKLLKGISDRLISGGKLIICDDFLTKDNTIISTAKHKKILADYKSGWQVGSLFQIENLRALAQNHNLQLTQNTDLTPYLNLWTLRDKFVHFFLRFYHLLPFRSNYWESIKGGDALQKGLLKGLLNYRFLVFTKE